jgi:hypothetical protein
MERGSQQGSPDPRGDIFHDISGSKRLLHTAEATSGRCYSAGWQKKTTVTLPVALTSPFSKAPCYLLGSSGETKLARSRRFIHQHMSDPVMRSGVDDTDALVLLAPLCLSPAHHVALSTVRALPEDQWKRISVTLAKQACKAPEKAETKPKQACRNCKDNADYDTHSVVYCPQRACSHCHLARNEIVKATGKPHGYSSNCRARFGTNLSGRKRSHAETQEQGEPEEQLEEQEDSEELEKLEEPGELEDLEELKEREALQELGDSEDLEELEEPEELEEEDPEEAEQPGGDPECCEISERADA